ncbi:hypothetical protein NEF87_001307 [Candidatus Lokiarchaeum ossiferum]|uniref:N(G),N(G)-dimethylarginine dimethylaminohydrolase n=1 Tax=Candidatus Lokiarchaeum ossiferum TaxID=2951803 RepID=A0ABY6HRK3_9ARCH|nr:hypothetical protein NEF87_001307 [Candidatus Lokiarchaeum sp. B-35]
MFTKAIVRTPCKKMVEGITTSHLGKPIYDIALKQHQAYIQALKSCGLEVIILPADERFPDSCFVEDTAVVNEKFAIVDRPGAITRQGEQNSIHAELKKHYSDIKIITAPGTLEGGDVMRIGSKYYVGLSDRTNHNGFNQFREICSQFNFEANAIEMNEMLHLKTGVNYLGDNTILVAGEFIEKEEFKSFTKIIVDPTESYAANCIRINANIIMPKGFPILKAKLQKIGVSILELEMSEFQKLDGGLSCLSLRF